jgi:hypothetical protein
MKSKANFSPVNHQLTRCEDIFDEKGTLISYFGILKENRISKQNKKMDPKFSRKKIFENELN